MMDVSGMALASYYLGLQDQAKEHSRIAVKGLARFRAIEDLERAYYNHYLIFRQGTRAERAAGEHALRKSLALVQARMRNMTDEKILARFKTSVPLVKAICESARTLTADAKT